MGSDHHYPEEAPAHQVSVEGFWMDRTPITNAQFLKFVKATGHLTLAEQPADPALYPDALPERLAPSSIVFVPPTAPVGLGDPYQWWHYVPGANWRHPEGPGSSIKGREGHPVVHVAHADALAYAIWAGKSLPSEPEWERAAWGGLEGVDYAWGTELHPSGRPRANTWQGVFPHQNTRLDGWERTSPVGSYPANGYGLVDMIGNVWEWTDDWYQEHRERQLTATRDNQGDRAPDGEQVGGCCGSLSETIDHEDTKRRESVDLASQHGAIPRKVVKGGSFLCAPNYCQRYRPAARLAQGIDTSTCHMGFRCVIRIREA
jgi:formylglycine-generating enzyme required for sulfatase activity